MKKQLPGTLRMESSYGAREIKIVELGATDLPTNPTPNYEWMLADGSGRDGFHKYMAPEFLRTWTFPKHVSELKERVLRILENGVPDQRRVVSWNSPDGILDDRFITDIALGEEVENPFWRWSKQKSDTVRVAICLDATVAWYHKPELLQSRMVVAAGLAAALEALDYEVSVVGAQLVCPTGKQPRQPGSNAVVLATVMKGQEESLVESGFAHFAETGLKRLMVGWVHDSNSYSTQMTDQEWRDITGADLLVYVGATGAQTINTQGLPYGSKLGPHGDETIRLGIDGFSHIDSAVEALESFFNRRD